MSISDFVRLPTAPGMRRMKAPAIAVTAACRAAIEAVNARQVTSQCAATVAAIPPA